MTDKRKVWVAAACAGVLALWLSAPAASFPLSGAVVKNPGDETLLNAAHRKRAVRSGRAYAGAPRARAAAPGPDPDCPWLKSWNPANPDRGFCDPGFAYHGNISGCVVDQGYGRWISCDAMMR